MLRNLMIAFVLLLTCGVALAQDSTPTTGVGVCTDNGRQTVAAKLLAAATALTNGTNDPQPLLLAQAALANYRADCANLVFTGAEYGKSVVTDPVVFPDGVYRVVLESSAHFAVTLTPMSGQCGDTFMFVSSEGGRKEGASVMQGCVALVGADGDAADWTLSYVPVVTNTK